MRTPTLTTTPDDTRRTWAHGEERPLCGEILVMPPCPCDEVVPQALRPWLADVELIADRADGGNSVRRKFLGEQLSGLFL
jgi:hypothetical protein